MGHCAQCGSELKPGKDFCTNCGAAVPQAPAEDHEPNPGSRAAKKRPDFFKSKQFKIIAIIAAVLLIGLFSGYKVIEAKNDPAKIVNSFETAVKKKDAKSVAKLLNQGQVVMDVGEKDAELLLSYFEDNPDFLTGTINALKKEAASLKNGVLLKRSKDSGQILHITKKGKKWLFFDQYGIDFEPVYFVLSVNQPDVNVSVNGKEQKMNEDEPKTFGPFLPVAHEIIATYEGKYGSVEVKEKVNPAAFSGNKIEVPIDLTENNVFLQSNYDDAVVFVNGKSTGKTVKELREFGPVSTDGSVKIHAEITEEGHKLKSKEVTITEQGQVVDLFIDGTPVYEAKKRKEEKEQELKEAEIDIMNVIYEHYASISYGDYSTAYDLFSSGRKKKISYEKWKEGLLDNVSNTINAVTVDSIDGDTATASFELTSRDYKNDGTILVQKFGGQWTLVKEFSGWKLAESNVKKLNSWEE